MYVCVEGTDTWIRAKTIFTHRWRRYNDGYRRQLSHSYRTHSLTRSIMINLFIKLDETFSVVLPLLSIVFVQRLLSICLAGFMGVLERRIFLSNNMACGALRLRCFSFGILSWVEKLEVVALRTTSYDKLTLKSIEKLWYFNRNLKSYDIYRRCSVDESTESFKNILMSLGGEWNEYCGFGS